jgi:hypothetical protein
MNLTTALGDFVPMEGDIIKSQYRCATFTNGQWRGTLKNFSPGLGYKYYSMREAPVSFVYCGSNGPLTVTTSDPTGITAIFAVGGGNVTSNDGTFILMKGICWATHRNPIANEDEHSENGSGTGSFTAEMTGLSVNTVYYMRAYAVSSSGTTYGEEVSFTTRDGIPEVSTDIVTNIFADCATCGGMVTDNGGLDVIARGVCWDTSPNPTINDSHTTSGSGLGSFTSSINGLTQNTTYHVRAWASTSHDTAYGEDVSFTTPQKVVIETINNCFGDLASCNGTVNVNWPHTRGVCWNTSPNPTINDFRIIEDRYQWECYMEEPWNINLFGDFTIQMRGLSPSTTYYVRAFVTEGSTVTYSNEICITTPAEIGINGMLPGVFSVRANQHVHFSQGNLQYRASTNTWRFALNQWSYVGGFVTDDCYHQEWGNVYKEDGTKCQNNDLSSSYSGWIDLFGWGTSGYNHGAICYQPWSISQTSSDYYAYGQSSNNLYDQTGQADWGNNPISNGGGQPNQWFTLSKDEWVYVLNTRNTPSGIRYAKANVNGVNGVILLPDDWSTSFYSLSNTNNSGASFSGNTITASQWNVLEQHGAVFLPETGIRYIWGYYVDDQYYSFGGSYYWSSSSNNNNTAWNLRTESTYVYPQDNSGRHNGMAVRLVCATQEGCPTVTTAEVSNITHCQATCGGTITYDGGDDATVRGICWSTSPNPTVADTHTIDGNGMGSFGHALTGLTPNTTYYVRAYAKNHFFTAYGNEVSFTTSQSPNFTVSVSADPTDGGSVSGGGIFTYGQFCSVQATANAGYAFVNWTVNGSVVSTNSDYTFTVTDNQILVANFYVGAINGKFTINVNGDQVLFSYGNLQYIGSAATPYWKFADNQWDYLGNTTGQNSSSQNVDRDLFGWGTSGYNHGAVCYQPWSTSQTNSDYYAYGNYQYNLYDQSGQADWGYNPISNGGNQPNQWRTLTNTEWSYVFNTRVTSSGIRFAKAKVNSVNGVILLPDDWNSDYYSLSNTNSDSGDYSSNTITAEQWNILEQHGAVFLPAAVFHSSSMLADVGSWGYYWSSASYYSSAAYSIVFSWYSLSTNYRPNRYYGRSVRLVRSIQ